jgi:hypothetical protein
MSIGTTVQVILLMVAWLGASVFRCATEEKPAAFEKDTGYRGIWYSNQPTNDEYVYKYSGGLGTYCAKHIPFAVYAPAVDKTFFVYGGTKLGSRSLLEMVSLYDHKTGLVPRPTIIMDKGTADAHDNPVISLDEQGYVWVFASSHGTARPSYIFKSKKPYSVDDFELVRETNFSYPQPWYIAGKGFLFLHTHYEGGRVLYWSTSADGMSWSAPSKLAFIGQGHYQVSWPHGNKVGTAFNYHPEGLGLNHRTNLYYIETSDMGSTWRNVRGDKIEMPITTVGNAALVHDYAAEGLKVYLKDINFDAEGRPVILHLTARGWEPGPENGPREWRVARWTGDSWTIHTVTTSDNNYDTGSLYVEPDRTWRIIGPTETGPQPFNPGGEVAVWTSVDHGETWKKQRQLTSASSYNHAYVRKPLNAYPGFYALWADGHGREPSESRLYFYDHARKRVMLLPYHMETEFAQPETVR